MAGRGCFGKALMALVMIALVALVVIASRHGGVFGIVAAAFGLCAGGALGGTMAKQAKREDINRALDEAKSSIRTQETTIREMQERHDREVEQVEKEHRDDSFDKLLASANERERRRKTGNMGK